MINQDKIDEWISEVEARPASAALIIQYIANRLSELARQEEELRAENIDLRSGRKVEEYESRIAGLEYQLELLKRQLGGEVIMPAEAPAAQPVPETADMFIYNTLGQVIRAELDLEKLASSPAIGTLAGEILPAGVQPNLLVTSSREELLFIFDTGRTVSLPASRIPVGRLESLDWQEAFVQEPGVREELAAIHPVARMPLYEACVQVSRRGYLKKMKTAFLASHMAENYIGTGVKQPADKTFGLTFARKDDLFVMVSQEGFVFSMPAGRLPTAIEEVVRLGISDHIIAAFTAGEKSSILFITQNGKAVHRDLSWLEPADTFKTHGQPILSKERREVGTRLAGAAPANGADWGIFLFSDGSLRAHGLKDLIASGSVADLPTQVSIVGFASISMPETIQ